MTNLVRCQSELEEILDKVNTAYELISLAKEEKKREEYARGAKPTTLEPDEPYKMDGDKYSEIQHDERRYYGKLFESSPFGRNVGCGDDNPNAIGNGLGQGKETDDVTAARVDFYKRLTETQKERDRRRRIPSCPHCFGTGIEGKLTD